MKKIIVIGCPGSGKSTFSRVLDEWIADGNFSATIELLDKYIDKNIVILKSREEAEAFLLSGAGV